MVWEMGFPEPEHPRHPARDRCQESASHCERRSAYRKPEEPKEPLTHGYFVRAESFCSIEVRVEGISGGGCIDRSGKTFAGKKMTPEDETAPERNYTYPTIPWPQNFSFLEKK
jgi:hypothetical protein